MDHPYKSIPNPTVSRIIFGMVSGMLLLILSVHVIFPNLQIPIIGIVPEALTLVDFVAHEIGHVIFSLFGEFIGVLGGTFAQLFIPSICIILTLRKKQWFSLAIFLFWLGQSLIQISAYVRDARTQTLKLFSPGLLFGGPSPLHDWHYLLDKTNLLWADQWVGSLILIGGVIALLASTGLLFAWGAGWSRLTD